MELIAHEGLFNALASEIERIRPEIFGAHTKRYKTRIPFPWNSNKSLNPILLKSLAAEVDYDGRGNSTNFRIGPQKLTLALRLDGAVLQTSKVGEVEAKFAEPVELSGSFSEAVDGTYPLVISEASFTQLQPVGIRTLLSWIIANAIAGALGDLGVPAVIELSDAVSLQLQRPVLQDRQIRISADLKVKK